ncbi:MAG: hypothetical protein ACI9G1_001520 [Pirellulaceae bacterium]|jgi:hypothetical protein
MNTKLLRDTFICTILLWVWVASGFAKNIDLVTLPGRERVRLTIYNSEDLTLVTESRSVTLKTGANQLQFSWAGTLIDPTSVRIRPLAHNDEIEVVDTVYSGQKPNSLIWNIDSEIEGQVLLEVSYFTSGLTWQMDYVAIANSEETKMDFRGYVRVFNNSGEEYDNAEIRLIVGKINLVEKIAKLALQLGIKTESEQESRIEELKSHAAKDSLRDMLDLSGAILDSRKKDIVKEGLSEYFVFAISGTETIRNGWSKRMESVNSKNTEFDIVYRMRAHQYGARPVRFFIWSNDEEHELGESPLPNGLVRIFRKNESDGLSYLGQQKLNYVPVRAAIEVNLGPDDLVVYKKRRTGTSRSEFAFHPNTRRVNGWNETQTQVDTVRNYRDKPIHFELHLRAGGDVEFTTDQPTTSFDFNTTETKLTVPSMGSKDYAYTLNFHHGVNAKQHRVKLILRK